MTLSRRKIITVGVPALALTAAGCQPTTAPPAAKAVAEPVAKNLFLMVDVVQGSKNLTDAQKPSKSCVLSSKFPRNSEIVWRARIFDPSSGTLLDDKVTKAQVRLANGVTADMQYGPHPKDPPGEAFWTGSWVVPAAQATGTLNYSVVASDTLGRSGEFKPFDSKPSLLTVTDEVYQEIPAKPKA